MSTQTVLTMTGSDHLREQYAEREALETCRSATFLAVVKHFGLVPSIVVHTPKGKDLTLEASDVWAARKKFFARMELDQHSCHLTVSGEALAELFSQWLLHEYSERYRCLTSEEQHQWLQRVVTLVLLL